MNRPSGSISVKLDPIEIYCDIVTLAMTLENGGGVDFEASWGAANVFQWDLAAAARSVHALNYYLQTGVSLS